MTEELRKKVTELPIETMTELHCHTDAYVNGIGDGAQSVPELVDTAIKKGAVACAITDHGNFANGLDFYNYCNGDETSAHKKLPKGVNIKPILGVEAYVTTEGYYDIESGNPETDKLVAEIFKDKEIMQHLVILAKNYLGMKQISRYVSATNRNIDDMGRPIGTVQLLRECFGPDAMDSGNVIAMSACIGGVLATPLAFNSKINHEIEKIEKRIEKSKSLLPAEYFAAREKVAKVNAYIDELNAEVEALAEKAAKKFKETKANIKAESDEAIKQYLTEKLELEMADSKAAKERTAELKKQIQECKASISEEKKILTKHKNKATTIESNYEKIDALNSVKKSDAKMLMEATEALKMYQSIFGEDNFYAEVQYHGDALEAELYPAIAKLARANGVKLVATNDNHMARPEDLKKRMLLKNCTRIKTGQWSGPLESDSELYFKTNLEKAEMLSQILPDDMVIEAISNIAEVVAKCNARLPETKVNLKKGITEEMVKPNLHYPEFKDADAKFRELCINGSVTVETLDGKVIEIACPEAGIEARYGDKWNDALQKRLDYELDTIASMGFSSYHLFIADVIGKCKSARENAMDIGPGRGSAAGSFACYNSGITELDPIELDLLFERFLNPERVSMPDIDTDFSEFAREFAINYVTETYGEYAIAGIMTKAIMGPLNALTYAPKLYAMERGEDTRAYASIGASLRGYARECSHLSEIEELINDKFGNDKVAMEIFSYAKMIEGYITSYGQHAAGIIALQSGRVEDYIPLICTNKDEKLAIQADMIQAEGQLGFLKFDFLGLKNLNVMTKFMRDITARLGITINPYHLPLDDARVYEEIFAKGMTNFIFQFESDGMKKMLLDLKPTHFIDLVLAVSVYRPGPLEFIPDIIRCKNTGDKSNFLQKFPVLSSTLDETYGYPVFQEQVMKIAQVIAGWTLGKADILRRYMSKKNEAALAEMRPEFIEGAVANGFVAEDANWLFDQLMPFAKYGFNKSHAAVYAFIAYVTAWAKCYYPAEYLCAAMTEQGKKTLQFISDCKKFGIEVRRVDINKSYVDFTVESENVIRIGFAAIKGLKNEADQIVVAREDGPFTSIKNFLVRTNLKSNSYEAVILAGACDDFTKNRTSCVDYIKELAAINDDVQKCMERLEEIEEMPETSPAESKKKDNMKIQWNNKLDAAQMAFDSCFEVSAMPLSTEHNLAFESEYLGMWTTGSPLEDYDLTKYKVLEEIMVGRALVAGVITGLRVFETKAGRKMASFTMLDKESTAISAVVFPNQFETLESVLKDNSVVEIRGTVNYRNGSGEDEEDEKQLIVDDVKLLSAKMDFITVTVPMMYMYAKIEQLVNLYKSNNGIVVRIIDWNNEIRDVLMPVSDAIVPELKAAGFTYSISK